MVHHTLGTFSVLSVLVHKANKQHPLAVILTTSECFLGSRRVLLIKPCLVLINTTAVSNRREEASIIEGEYVSKVGCPGPVSTGLMLNLLAAYMCRVSTIRYLCLCGLLLIMALCYSS